MIKETTVSNFLGLIRRERDREDPRIPHHTLTKVQTEKECLATKKAKKPVKMRVDSQLRHLPQDSFPAEGEHTEGEEPKTSMYQMYFRSLERKHYQRILDGE